MKTQSLKENISWSAIVLAGGKGTRMGSPLPKVLHPAAGRPLIERVIEGCRKSGIESIRLVVGHGKVLVQTVAQSMNVEFFEQKEQLGTADAVISAEPHQLSGRVLILSGDHPLVSAEDLKPLMDHFEKANLDLAVVSVVLPHPQDFGRIVRSSGTLQAIVEAKDASHDTLKIQEVNTGIYFVKAEHLASLLEKVENKNAKQEYYLTDIVQIALKQKLRVEALKGTRRLAFGVNSQAELARASRYLYKQKAELLMNRGVLILDPRSTYIEDTVEIGPGSVVYPNVFIRGRTKIGPLCSVEPNCFIVDSQIGEAVHIKANTYLERVTLLNRCQVGPFARLRPETTIGEEAHVGNFVEMKKVQFGAKSKAGHLTYLGDAEVGSDTNIGCGTITCNYAIDKKKYKTVIGNRVFVGSDTQFVAPVEVGHDAIVGSGSTITKSVPAGALAIARGQQRNIENFAERSQKSKKETQT